MAEPGAISTSPPDADGDQNKGEGKNDITTFRLLDLPAELLLRIVEFTVIEKAPICITARIWRLNARTTGSDDTSKTRWKTTVADRIQPAISRVSRIIRVDAIKMYYQNNVFESGYCMGGYASEGVSTIRWLRAIGKDNRHDIRELIVVEGGLWLDGVESFEEPGPSDECLLEFKRRTHFLNAIVSGPLENRGKPCRMVTFAQE